MIFGDTPQKYSESGLLFADNPLAPKPAKHIFEGLQLYEVSDLEDISAEDVVFQFGNSGDLSQSQSDIMFNGDPEFNNQAVTGGAEFDNIRNAGLDTDDLWSAIKFDGTGDYIDFPYSADWDFAGDDFTVDWWEKRAVNVHYAAAYSRTGFSGSYPFAVGMNRADTTRTLTVYVSSNNSSWDIASNFAIGTYTLDQWAHWAFVRNGNTWTGYKNGIFQASFTDSKSIHSLGYRSPSIGCYSSFLINGGVKLFRLTKGSALWTTGFTPPIDLQTDYIDQITSDTKLLLSMSGDTAAGHSSNDVHDITVDGEPTIGVADLGGSHYASVIEFDGSNYFSIAGTETGIKSIDFWLNPDIVSRDILKLSSTVSISLNGSGEIALTGLPGWTTYIDGAASVSVGTGSWKHVGIRGVSTVDLDGGEIGRVSSYFDGELAHVRFCKKEINFKKLWQEGKLYNLEDAYI